MSDYYDLGSYSRPIGTASAEAQNWFDRGLIWTYAFNHEEAAKCFGRALEYDPECGPAYWGLAYSIGPNYNKPWNFFDSTDLASTVAQAFRFSSRAQEYKDAAGEVERDLILSLRARYPSDHPAADCSIWDESYADVMREVYHRHPGDLDVAALFAEALMIRTPWALWDQRTGAPAGGAHTLEARRVLESAMESPDGANHPGVLHMYIHLMEMSPTPETALKVGDRLRDLVPDAGHLRHMPTHLDVLCGDYRSVVASNTLAIAADEKYAERDGAINFYTLYRSHNYHFKIYGAMFLGQAQTALTTAERLEQAIPEELLKVSVPPMADWLEGFLSIKMHVYIRFGMWDEIINTELPRDQELYSATTAMIRYAKGVAYSATGRIAEAEDERNRFRSAVAGVPESRTLFNNTCLDILRVAEAMLEGELEYRKGNFEEAFSHLRRSIDLDDNLPYDEPWGWMQPARHAYGALLLEQGRVAEAAAVYRADLGLDDTLPRACQHPGNVWSLHGYHECLTALGKQDEAKIIDQQLKVAAAYADVPINASCYCRLSKAGSCCSDT